MTARGGYALDLLSPVRHVATEMERAGSEGPAPTIKAMTATYENTIAGDLARIRDHEGVSSDYQARVWLIRRAVSELGRQVVAVGDGYRLAKPFDQLKYKGRKVRRTVRAGEESEKEVLQATYQNLAHELRPFRVTVAGARDSSREMELTLHPLAHAIPRMTEKEFGDLAADVKANGIKMPILVMGGKVIDGRHRLAVAAALKMPVRTEKFTGSEDEARRHIISLNLIRRNLTMAQRGLIVRQILLPEAEAEAQAQQKRAGKSHGRGQDSLPPNGEKLSPGKTAAQIAAERSSGLATARTIERMKDVDNAPKTQERIRSGEIKTAADAARESAAELGKTPVEPQRQPRSAWDNLGSALASMRYAVESLETAGAARGSGISTEKFLARIADIRNEAARAEKLVRP